MFSISPPAAALSYGGVRIKLPGEKKQISPWKYGGNIYLSPSRCRPFILPKSMSLEELCRRKVVRFSFQWIRERDQHCEMPYWKLEELLPRIVYRDLLSTRRALSSYYWTWNEEGPPNWYKKLTRRRKKKFFLLSDGTPIKKTKLKAHKRAVKNGLL
jgi:hypothetical protein